MSRGDAKPAADESIIQRCKNHDLDAFGLLINRYGARVFGFVSRTVRDRDDAEDIAQEVFVRAFQNVGRFDGRASFLTWLFKIATILSIDRARKMGRGPAFVSFGDDADSHGTSAFSDVYADPETQAIVGEMESAIEAAILGLSEKLRMALLLHDLGRKVLRPQWLPGGFKEVRRGMRKFKGKLVLMLHYSDGRRNFTIFQGEGAITPSLPETSRRGVALRSKTCGGVWSAIVGRLKPETLDRILLSLRGNRSGKASHCAIIA